MEENNTKQITEQEKQAIVQTDMGAVQTETPANGNKIQINAPANGNRTQPDAAADLEEPAPKAVKSEKKAKYARTLEFVFMFIVSGAIAGLGTMLYKRGTDELICNIVMVMLGTGIVIFALLSSEIYEMFFYEHQGKYKRFIFFYLLGLILSVLFPLLPVSGWPFLVVFVVLSLFSNQISGLAAGSVCLMLAITLENTGTCREFILYFFSGLVGIMVFGRLGETFKVAIPIFISLLCMAVCLSANIILFENERFSLSQYMFVAINLMMNFILLLIVLKIFNNSVIHKDMDKYTDLNDPECPLLVQLKELNKNEYYHAVHTAYLGDRIAKRLGLNDAVVKACGYYHRIGILKGENTWENVSEICKEYHIPEDTVNVLREYIDPSQKMIEKETAVLLFTDCIVTSIIKLFAKDPKAELNYDRIINAIFDAKLKSGELWNSEISIAEIRKMKKIFSEEKLYYDFLR